MELNKHNSFPSIFSDSDIADGLGRGVCFVCVVRIGPLLMPCGGKACDPR